MEDDKYKTYKIPAELWERVKPLLPPKPYPSESDSRMDARKAMGVVFCILRRGYTLEQIADNPGGECETLYYYFREWLRTGTFDRLWQVGIITFDELKMLVRIIMQ